MDNWQRRALGILAIGGGAIGLSSSMMAVLQGRGLATTNLFVIALGMGFFLWGVWCGVQMIEVSAQAVRRNAFFWLAQVPLLQTPILGYTAFCGAQLQVFIKLSPIDATFAGSVLGAQFGLNLGQPGARIAIGINVLAAGVAFWLIEKNERAESAPLLYKPADTLNR